MKRISAPSQRWRWYLAAAVVVALALNAKRVKNVVWKPKGIRNNNPGNIRATATIWQGQVGDDGTGFAVFDTPENGIRAMARTLHTYATSYGITTVQGIISRWAPANENDTASYVQDVAARMDVGDTQPLVFSASQLVALVAAIINHENGMQPYTDAQLLAGIRAAGWPV